MAAPSPPNGLDLGAAARCARRRGRGVRGAWLYGPVAGRPTERGDAVNDRIDNAPVDDRPEIPAQSPEKVDSAPGFPASPVAALAERGDAVGDRVYKPAARADRPANPTQSSEMVQSPPGNPVAALHSPSRDGRPHERPTERGDAVNDRVDKAAASSARPENPAQIPEKVEIRARDRVELSDRRGLSSRPGLDSRPHPEPVEERCGSPGPPLRLERATSRRAWRRSTAWRRRHSICRPGSRRPAGKSGGKP